MAQDTTSRPRRLTARGAATRERIVVAATDLMYVRGVGATSLDDVVDASGTGKSQLYHYFADKDALVLAVVSTQIDRVLGFQEPLLRDLDSLRDLERWRNALVSGPGMHEGGHGCPLGSLAAELADHSPAVRSALVHGFDAWEELIRDGLARVCARGELAADTDPSALAAGIMAALQGGLLLAQTHRDPRRLAVALDMALGRVPGWNGAPT
ncbi:transcriptional regulator [Actinomycetospora sp. NBRC 106375]|uniref:TetR/AcrR family transcriptional regulator n=1 Tax=Actinomycetospora sp. NBRC 106375 TaxID=3032207 RepID=UPI0024A4D300|nr:TetR/AcrR family transcriptional regulator [Actinomycetospora sp. NBRC 106375]GLZ48980.1 transcriptional regulator [Actinomycetospora sp. NBRC 106375]